MKSNKLSVELHNNGKNANNKLIAQLFQSQNTLIILVAIYNSNIEVFTASM